MSLLPKKKKKKKKKRKDKLYGFFCLFTWFINVTVADETRNYLLHDLIYMYCVYFNKSSSEKRRIKRQFRFLDCGVLYILARFVCI